MNLSTATSPISQVRHRCALGENFGGYTEAINPGSQHSRITLEHPKTLQDKCHTHIPPLPPRFHRNAEFTGKTLSRLDPLHALSFPPLITTHRGHQWRTPTPAHLLLYLITVKGPCHLIPHFEDASSFWKEHLQAITGPFSPSSTSSRAKSPDTGVQRRAHVPFPNCLCL